MPTRSDRSSARAVGWLCVLAGVGDGWATRVLIGGLPVRGTAATYLAGVERRLPVQRDERDQSGGTPIPGDPMVAAVGAEA
jgi:hypothetical protein